MVAIAKETVGRNADQDNDGNRSIVRPWSVYGAASEAEAIAAVAAEAPAIVDALAMVNVSVNERVKDVYECQANYGTLKPFTPAPILEVGQSQFNFEVATQPQRIIVPIKPQTVYPKSGLTVPANHINWLIGQQGNEDPPTGADVSEPVASFSESHILSVSTITAAQQRVLLKIVGRLNQFSFRGWAAEEVLCTGISGSKRGSEDWEVSFRFGVREHQTGITVAGIEGVDKKGWQFLWVRYATTYAGDAKVMTNVAEYVVVADVYKTANFANLGIGS
jgi:hypothetical protein